VRSPGEIRCTLRGTGVSHYRDASKRVIEDDRRRNSRGVLPGIDLQPDYSPGWPGGPLAMLTDGIIETSSACRGPWHEPFKAIYQRVGKPLPLWWLPDQRAQALKMVRRYSMGATDRCCWLRRLLRGHEPTTGLAIRLRLESENYGERARKEERRAPDDC